MAEVDGAGRVPAVDGRCEECGFDYDGLAVADTPAALRAFGRRYRAPLTRGLPGEALDDLLRAHPVVGVWSALEYACHVRDVFAVQRERVLRGLTEDTPRIHPMGGVGREAMAVRDRYNEQDPVVVLDELAANAEALAATLDELTEAQWERTMIYGYPEPSERDLGWLARHTVHEGNHHLLDIGRGLRAARGR